MLIFEPLKSYEICLSVFLIVSPSLGVLPKLVWNVHLSTQCIPRQSSQHLIDLKSHPKSTYRTQLSNWTDPTNDPLPTGRFVCSNPKTEVPPYVHVVSRLVSSAINTWPVWQQPLRGKDLLTTSTVVSRSLGRCLYWSRQPAITLQDV